MKLKLYLIGCVLFLVSTFSEAIPVSSDDIFMKVIYDYNYHKFIAVGRSGTIATSVDGKKWFGYVIPELDTFLAIESSTSTTSEVSILTAQKLYNFDPNTGRFTFKQAFSDRATFVMIDPISPNMLYRVNKITDKSTSINKCTRNEAGQLLCKAIWIINDGTFFSMSANNKDQLYVTIKDNNGRFHLYFSANTERGFNFTRIDPFNIGLDDQLTASGDYLYDWRKVATDHDKEATILQQIYVARNDARPNEWTPIGEYHQPERLDSDTYAAVFGGGSEAGLSDDEDTFIMTGRNSESQVVLFAAEISARHKIFRPFLTEQFGDIGERLCGASGKVDGKVITVLLGSGNKVLVSTGNKKLWQVFTM